MFRKPIMIIIAAACAASSVFAVSADEAKTVALRDAGVADTGYVKVERDRERGVKIFDVSFYADGVEYDYEINADTGAILSKDYEVNTGGGSNEVRISEGDAVNTALSNAGVAESSLVYIRTKLERDDWSRVYDVEFSDGSTEYDYTIDAASGSIISAGLKHLSQVARPSFSVSIEEAGRIALSNVPGATERDMRIKSDFSDGRPVYEGKIIKDGREYEFEIDAENGMVTEWESEKHWF